MKGMILLEVYAMATESSKAAFMLAYGWWREAGR